MAQTRLQARHSKPREADFYRNLFEDEDDKDSRIRLRASTLQSVQGVWKRWEIFCAVMGHKDAVAVLDKIDKKMVKAWIYWVADTSSITKLSSLAVVMRFWRQSYRLHTLKALPINIASEMTNYLQSEIRTEFELSEEQQDKPVVNVDDLLYLLYHHWVQCTDVYPTERHRVQQALLMLLCAYTSARPATIIEAYRRPIEELGNNADTFQVSCKEPDARRDSLKYKDVNIFKVRDPDSPSATMLVMIIKLRLHKGSRHAGAAPCYILYERDDNLAFCPILHVLALAFADHAFKSDWLRSPCDIERINVPEFLMSVPLEWKDEMQAIPLLRNSCRSSYGTECSPNAGLPYVIANMHTVRLGKSAGFKENFNLYSLRRGAGEAIDKVATAAERNRAMGHSRSEIFDKYYVNQKLSVDFTSAYLGTPSRDAIVRLASHMSLTRDPRVRTAMSSIPTPHKVPDHDLEMLDEDLRNQRCAIVAKYGSLKKASGTALYTAYMKTQKAGRALRKKSARKQQERQRKEWFDNLGCNEIDRQRRGIAPLYLPEAPTLHFPERKQLAEKLFRNEDVDTLPEDTVRADRILALEAMVSLCSRRETRHNRTSETSSTFEDDMESTDDLGVCHGLQCPWCFPDVRLSPKARVFMFCRLDVLQKHVEKQHVSQMNATDVCPYATCGFKFDKHEGKLNNHMAACHGLHLRAKPHHFDSPI